VFFVAGFTATLAPREIDTDGTLMTNAKPPAYQKNFHSNSWQLAGSINSQSKAKCYSNPRRSFSFITAVTFKRRSVGQNIDSGRYVIKCERVIAGSK